MSDKLEDVRQTFLETMDVVNFVSSELEKSLSKIDDLDWETKLFQVEIQYPIALPPGKQSGFCKSIIDDCDGMLIGISSGNQIMPTIKGNFIDKVDGKHHEDTMQPIKYDISPREMVPFATYLHKVIGIIQSMLKQKCVYVKIDTKKVFADTLKCGDDYYPDQNEFGTNDPECENFKAESETLSMEEIEVSQSGTLKIGKIHFSGDHKLLNGFIANLLQFNLGGGN
ncbi:MAG: hypothetical protein QGI21_03225 [Candidatus Poseidoniaceae archaeon]|jgi:hypothetical protein|nr:hypothetical protein [Candidatus Poseidoniaceae archaeon]